MLKNYGRIISKAPFCSLLIDSNGQYISANIVALQLLGLSGKKLKAGFNLLEYKPFIDAGIDVKLRECMVTGRPSLSEHILPSAKNKRTYILLSLSPVRQKGNKCAGIWIAIDDTTVVRHVEDALKETEDQFRAVIEHAIDGIAIVQDGVYRYANPAFCRIMGVKPEDMTGVSYLTFIDPESRDAVIQRFNDRQAGREVLYPYEVKVRNAAGEIRDIEYSGRFMRFEGKAADLLFVRDITEKKRIENELKNEQRRSQNYLDTAEVILLVLDREGRVVLVNRKGKQVFGYDESEIIGQSWFDLFLIKSNREKARAVYHKYISGELPVASTVVSRIMTAGNKIKYISWHSALLKDDTGNIIGTIHSGTDITRQRQLERQLEMRARLLDLAIDSIYMLDEEGNFRYVNESTCKTRGYTREELIGKNVRELVSDDNKQLADQRIRELLDHGELIFESLHRRKDGTYFPVDVHASRVEIEGRIFLTAIARDISERKLADQVLSRSEERFRTILDEMDNGYFELDSHGYYIFVNDAMCKILGLSRSDIIAKHFSAFVDPADEKFLENIVYIEQTVSRGDKVSGIFGTIIKGDGTRRIIGISISAMKDHEGRIVGVRGITRDITDRMKMEQQLVIASKLASIGELAAGVAHEINNPLTAITGFAQLLIAEEGLPAQVKQDLEKIYLQSQRAAKIVQNLLTFSRSYQLERQVIDINDLILKTLEMRSYEHRVSNIEVISDLARDLPGVLADENQIQQVMLNVIVNAEQAIIAGRRSGIIKVATSQAGRGVRVTIADNGPGIPQGIIEKIFDPFFTTKAVGSGTGLGLSVCHGIITKHGGTISADSVEGAGATFTIELPAAKEEKMAAAAIPVIPKKAAAGSGRKTGILVVDDEVVIRDILQRILSERGYEVDLAESGAEGLNKMETREYDVYLLDIKMPGIDGRDLFEVVTKNFPYIAGRIIFITGDTITQSTQEFLNSTGRPYLSKPFNFSSLIALIEETIKAV